MIRPRSLTALALVLLAVACARAETPTAATESQLQPESLPEGLTAKQQAAYEQCLHDNMAVATAWEMIEQGCLEEVTAGRPRLTPDP